MIDRVIYSEGMGTVLFRPMIDGLQSRDIEFSRVLHVPALKNNLLAVLHLTKKHNFHIHIWQSTIQFDINGPVLFTAHINDNNVGYLNGSTVDIMESASLVSTLPLDLELWHKRFSHLNYGDISKLLKEKLVEGLRLDSDAKPDPICELCLAGKMRANPFPSSTSRAKHVLELIHSDLH